MERIKKILAPTDMSELSQAGVRYAFDLARRVGAEVTVYHVLSTDELMQRQLGGPLSHILKKYEQALQKFLDEHFSDILPLVEVRTKVEIGVPDDNIVQEAEKDGMDMVVLSTHGRTGLSHILVGSVTERVVRHAPCPVLSTRPKAVGGTKVAAAA
jgi:nucleotide-binding universal stress UspA family protein